MRRPAELLTRCGRTFAAASALALLIGSGVAAQTGKLDSTTYSATASREATTTETLLVPLGQSHVFRTEASIERLVIGDPNIADVVMMSPNSFYVLGKGLGRTNLQAYSGGDFPSAMFEVEVSADLGDLGQAIRSAVPGADVTPRSINGRLRLEGTVPDALSLARILEIAAQYSTEEVVNAIRVSSPQQVYLEVRMVEASRSATVELGVELTAFHADAGRLQSGASAGNASFGSFVSSLIEQGLRVDTVIDALEQRGLARSLAEPTLTALSGETASFLAGGEVPVPVSEAEDGNLVVGYKEFGVRLTFTPTVLDNGLINLRLEPEVSDIDVGQSLTAGAITYPSFNTRRASTTVELADGQSFAIAGLLQRNSSRQISQLPWLGDLPLLGALFRSAAFQDSETDLVIIVTPHLSRPARASEPLATPLDFTAPSNKAELFLFGKHEIRRDTLARTIRQKGIAGPFGHIVDFQELNVDK